jgi:hypothetical protein
MKVFVLILHGETQTDHEVVKVSVNKKSVELAQSVIEAYLNDADYYRDAAMETDKKNYVIEGGERKQHRQTKILWKKYGIKMEELRKHLMSIDKKKFAPTEFHFGETRPWTELEEMECETS